MNIGDIGVDQLGNRWIAYDFSPDGLCVYVTDPATHKINEYIPIGDFVAIEKKPMNVEWLFIARRLRNFRKNGLEMFL